MTRRPIRRALLLLAAAGIAPLAAQSTPLTLGEAARLGAQQSAAAQGARYRSAEYAARAAQSRAALLPAVTAGASDGQRSFNTASFGLSFPGFDPDGEVIGPVRTVDVRGRVAATLYSPGALGRYRTAQAATSGAEADARAVAEQAATVAALNYVRALRADARVDARAADSTLATELLAIARAQLRAGTGIALDVTRAQAQLAGVRTALIAARNERDHARIDLLRSLGLPATAQVELRDSLGAPIAAAAPPTLADALSAARAARPELRAASAAVETARRARNGARAERLPTLGLFGDDGATSNGYAHLLNTYTYGVQLSVPIWEGGKHGARVDELTAALRQAETRLADLEAQVEADAATAILDLTSAQEQVTASSDRLQLAEQEMSQARERFRAGVAGNSDVIAAQLNLDTARSLHVDVLAALQTARIALARAEGRVTSLP